MKINKSRGFYPMQGQTNLKKRAPIKNTKKRKKKVKLTPFITQEKKKKKKNRTLNKKQNNNSLMQKSKKLNLVKNKTKYPNQYNILIQA